METTTTETKEMTMAREISPCTNCGSIGYTQRSDGEYVRGCCRENGDHRVTPPARLGREERDAEIAAGISALFTAGATDVQLADYREGWHEGFRAFTGDLPTGRTPEYRAGFEAGYLQGVHEEA